MAGPQQTFQLIPTTLASSKWKPPMTSKQAKKAWAKRQAGPRISRAEQRKRDAEESERQRKEYERERAAAKAKAAREKKVAKLAAEKEERKKKGLPEPSKFVRASQPTISIFVKGNGKREWKQMENMVEADVEEGCAMGGARLSGDEAEPPAKRVALDQAYEMAGTDTDIARSATKNGAIKRPHGTEDGESYDIPSPNRVVATQNYNTERERPKESSAEELPDERQRSSTEAQTLEKKDAVEPEPVSDDEFGDFPSLSQADILEKIASSMGSFRDHPSAPVSPEPKMVEGLLVDCREGSSQLPHRPSTPKQESYDDSMLETSEAASREIQGVEAENAETENRFSKPPVEPIEIQPKGPVLASHLRNITLNTPSNSPVRNKAEGHICLKPLKAASPMRRPTMQEHSINIPPPKHPVERIQVRSSTSLARKRQVTPQNPSKPKSVTSPYAAPPKFFLKDRNTTPVVPPRKPHSLTIDNTRLSANMPPSSTQAFLETYFDDFFPSPTQEERELRKDTESLPSNTQVSRELTPLVKSIRYDLKGFDYLVSTQDLIMSSQDMREIGTPTSTPQATPRKMAQPPPRPSAFKEKRRFFQEKEEDLKRAGLLREQEEIVPKLNGLSSEAPESFPEDEESPLTAIKESKKLETERQAVCAPSNDCGEEDSLLAAIEESEKLEAERAAACRPPTNYDQNQNSPQLSMLENERLATLEAEGARTAEKPRRKFEEKEDLRHAAIYESKILLTRQKQTVPIRDEAPVREHRTLKRASSGVTDYGDDEIFSSQELLALF